MTTDLDSRKIAKTHPDAGQKYAKDFSKIFGLTVSLLIAMFGAMIITAQYTEWFFTPGRGHWIFVGHEVSLILSLAALLLLVWWAALRHYRCRTFLVGLDKELQDTRRSLVIRNRSDAKENASLSAREIRTLEDYAGMSSVTLLPPFAMMVLMVVSRHTLFDGWNVPLTLFIFLSFMLFILLVSAFQLSSAARNLKRTELNYHKISAEPDMMKRKAAETTAVWQDAAGPFGSYQQQPIIQALFFAATGFGIGLIEPMFQFFGL